jgi:hypothetical protein
MMRCRNSATIGNDYLTDGAAASYHGTPRTYGIRFGYTYQ